MAAGLGDRPDYHPPDFLCQGFKFPHGQVPDIFRGLDVAEFQPCCLPLFALTALIASIALIALIAAFVAPIALVAFVAFVAFVALIAFTAPIAVIAVIALIAPIWFCLLLSASG
jgi:hypothetical protein